MFSPEQLRQATEVLELFRQKKWLLATAESCTGGLVSALMTEIAGSSDVFDRGFVTYSNDAKCTLLDVPLLEISRYGAVSEEVAASMAHGTLDNSRADIALSITGIAGPGGGSAEKPVGLVFIGIATRSGDAQVERYQFTGSRHEIRMLSLEKALQMLRQMASHSPASFS